MDVTTQKQPPVCVAEHTQAFRLPGEVLGASSPSVLEKPGELRPAGASSTRWGSRQAAEPLPSGLNFGG